MAPRSALPGGDPGTNLPLAGIYFLDWLPDSIWVLGSFDGGVAVHISRASAGTRQLSTLGSADFACWGSLWGYHFS